MTIATADWLTNGGSIVSYYDVYGNRFKEGGFGKQFQKWLSCDKKEPYKSNGNGSAMRVSPVGCFGNSIDEVIKLSTITASCTHDSKDGIEGANFVASVIYWIRQGLSKEEIKGKLKEMFTYNIDKSYDEVKEYYGWRWNDGDEVKYGGLCENSVPYAFIAFFESTDFEDAIRKAVSLGGDSDTLGAICGGMAGAYYGIPDKFVKEIYDRIPNEFADVISKFSMVANNNNKK